MWICLLRYSYYQPSHCKGRLIIKNGLEVKESKPHSHLPDARLLEKSKEINKLKKKATVSNKMPRELVSEACSSMNIQIAPMLPTTRSLTRLVTNLQRERTEMKNPKTLEELIFSPNTVVINGRNFLLHDSAVSNPNLDRIVIFGTSDNLKLLASCSIIAMDGTFKVTPPLFYQLFTIHGNKRILHFVLELTSYTSTLSHLKGSIKVIGYHLFTLCARTKHRKPTNEF